MRDVMEYGVFFFVAVGFLFLLACGAWVLARSRRPSTDWRSRAVKVALMILGLLGPLLAAEGYLLFGLDTTDGTMATLTSRRWVKRHLPHPLGTYRGRRTASTDAWTRRTLYIAVLGDSVTYGQGIKRDEDLYPSLLERELGDRDIAANVYNISYMGWDTRREVKELRRQLESGGVFDAVVLGFCLNDIESHVRKPPGFLEALVRFQTPPAWIAPLVRHSFLASLLYNRYVTLTSPVVRQTWHDIVESYRSTQRFQPLAADLMAFKQLADAYGAPLVALTFPDTTTPWADYPYRDIHRKIEEFWKGLGVRHVDLLPAFEHHPPRSLQVGLLDTHPNEFAHGIAAAELASALAEVLAPRRN